MTYMEIQQGYKKTEVGVIPEDWEVKKLIDISNFSQGIQVDLEKQLKTEKPKYLKFLRIENYTQNSEDFRYIPSDLARNKWISIENIVVVRYGATAGYIGKGKEGVLANNLFKVEPIQKFIINDYLYRYLKSDYTFNYFQKSMFGGAMPALSFKVVKELKIPFPPTKAEQTAIATVLNDADALISQLENLIAKKRAIKQGAMQELLKPKAGWEVKKLGEVFKFLRTANNSRADLLQDGDFEYIHYGDIHTKWKNFLDCSKNVLPCIPYKKIKSIPFLNEGDLIIADASEDYEGLGACVEIKSIGNRKIVAGLHTMLLRGDKEIILDGFKGYFRNFHGAKEALIASSTGVSVYGISKTKLKDIEIKIPPKTEQTRIAQILSDMDTELEALEKKLEKYKRIKQGMMQVLLTGKVRLI